MGEKRKYPENLNMEKSNGNGRNRWS